jgi:hypothetical protein
VSGASDGAAVPLETIVVVVIDVVIVGIADDRHEERLGLAGADAVIAVSDEQTTSVDELQLRRSIEQRDTSSWESLTVARLWWPKVNVDGRSVRCPPLFRTLDDDGKPADGGPLPPRPAALQNVTEDP